MYTLGDIPRKTALVFPDREAVVYEGTRYTYREFDRRVNRLANAISELGYAKADRMTVLADNCSKYLEAYFAAAKLGMSITPLNYRLGDKELAYVIEDSESSLFMVGDGFEERFLSLAGGLSGIKHKISMDNPLDGALLYDELLEAAPDRDPGVEVDENEMAVLMYTGGTTGMPKGVMLSHRNFMTGVMAMAVMMTAGPDDSTCYVLPIFHVSIWPIFVIMVAGGKVVINRRYDLGLILETIEREKCTHINLVPTIYGWVLQFPDVDKYDLSSLRGMTYAGSPFPPEVLKQCITKFGNIFAQGYGSTETAGAPISYLLPEDHHLEGPGAKYLASAGKPAMCSEVAILDEEDNQLPPGGIGEIAARGKMVMQGYWKNPELTEKTLRGGWLHTGDMGYMDEDGYLFLVDRKADMIVTGGENVYPKETEDVLFEHPAVFECAVVSAPDEKWGERVQAVVVLKEGQSASEEELIAFCKERLAGYKCPKAVAFKASIPKTVVGKILRKEVKKEFWEGKDRSIG